MSLWRKLFGGKDEPRDQQDRWAGRFIDLEQLDQELSQAYEHGRRMGEVALRLRSSQDPVQERERLDKEVTEEVDRLKQRITQLCRQGQYEQANQLTVEMCNFVRASGNPFAYFDCLNWAGLLWRSEGYPSVARTYYEEALEVGRPLHGKDISPILNNLAEIHLAAGSYADAEPLYRELLELRRQALGADHPDFAEALEKLGLLYQVTGNYAAAAPLLRQALEIQRRHGDALS